MPIMPCIRIVLLWSSIATLVLGQTKILLSDDNGWAVAHVRAPFAALRSAGHNVLLVAPADDASTGIISPFVPILNQRILPCQFNTCPGLLDALGLPLGVFPATGSNSTDNRLNYVTAFTVGAVQSGIENVSPTIFSSPPDLVLVGVHIGNTVGNALKTSGLISAAAFAINHGIPAITFSGATGSQVSYTTLESDPTSQSSIAAQIYSTLLTNLVNKLTTPPGPILPPNIGLNVNFPSTANCATASSIKFVLSRLATDPDANSDSCTNLRLPLESAVLSANCLASISLWDVNTKEDADPLTQAAVMFKLLDILTCPNLS
ncbi:hypothetical protein ONZ45_g1195 [Pleurotus djamor]|nr:hypothetical protein ONZ45_g1195 [Pleurotus djamor]